MKRNTPNTDQMMALSEWARIHGRLWKTALRHAWMTGDYDGFDAANFLQQVRNEFGPSWLISFRLN
jgi:hypothetical protein